jgi:ketosteroid isomerase-like protein
MVKADTESERIVMRFFETLSTSDFDRIREFIHDEATWVAMVKDIPGVGVHKGKKGIVDEFLKPIRGMFAPGDPKVTLTSMASKGPLVICESTGSGKVADGRPYDNLYCWAIELKDGKIYRLREYMDSLYISKLFGEK